MNRHKFGKIRAYERGRNRGARNFRTMFFYSHRYVRYVLSRLVEGENHVVGKRFRAARYSQEGSKEK